MEPLNSFDWEQVLLTGVSVLIGIVGYFLMDFKSRVHKMLDQFHGKLEEMQKDHGKIMVSTTAKLSEHKDAMGMATKAIHGDMLSIRQSVTGLKEQVAQELINMKDEVSALQRNASNLVNDLKISTSQFNDKFNKIVELQATLNETHQTIIVLEKGVDALQTKVENQEKIETETKEVIEGFRKEIIDLKKQNLSKSSEPVGESYE